MSRSIPYYSQWESRQLVCDFIAGARSSLDDPLWENSGASSAGDYAQWAPHICGLACLKMLLAAKTGVIYSTFQLLDRAKKYGAYVLQEGDIRGMIYAPAVVMLKQDFGIEAEVVTHLDIHDMGERMSPDDFFIASVHPSIRWPEQEPAGKGGHLVLVTEVSADTVRFHNPSGDTVHSQENVVGQVPHFQQYFAGRGIWVR